MTRPDFSPYTDQELRDFAGQRLHNLNNTGYVRFVKAPGPDGERHFAVERGIDAKRNLPYFLTFKITDLDDATKMTQLTEEIRRVAEHYAATTKDAKNDTGKENHALFSAMAANPENYGRALKARFDHYGPMLKSHLRAAEEKRFQSFQKDFDRLPPWMQMTMMESDTVYRDANGGRFIPAEENAQEKGIKGLIWRAFGTVGLFDSSGGVVTQKETRMVDSVDWSKSAGSGTLWHEEGHKLSHYAAKRVSHLMTAEPSKVSELAEWQAAVASEALRPTPRNLGLRMHLLQYPKKDHAEEALAEMTRHYVKEFMKRDGTTPEMDQSLSRDFPKCWPVFRDKILPEYINMAKEKYQGRLATRAAQEAERQSALSSEVARLAKAVGQDARRVMETGQGNFASGKPRDSGSRTLG